MLLANGVRYELRTPKDEEKEFHPMIKEHFKEIFGENSLYFDVKHVLKTQSGIGSIPDAYVISLSKPNEWYVVENELSSHPVYNHIVNQLSRFVSGVKNRESQNQIVDMLYDEINRDGTLKATVKKLIDTDDIHHFLSKLLLSVPPRIVVIIDQKTLETEDACESLKIKDIVEFKTFVKENDEKVHAHLFEPLSPTGKPPTASPKELPEHYESWEKMLAWVDPHAKELTKLIEDKIFSTYSDVNKEIHGRYCYYYKGKPSPKSRFAVIYLTKSYPRVTIRTDPKTFKDPEKLAGDVLKGWFFKPDQERAFSVTSSEQLNHAMELIRQSYSLSK